MTREERLELLKQIEKDIYVPSIESTFLDDAKSCAIHSVIEELEQEPFINKPCVSSGVCEHDKQIALNKIRAEILDCLKALDDVEKFNIYLPNEIAGRRLTYQQCLGFIDKYKAESEGQGMTDIERKQKKNCDNCKYGYLSSDCKEPNAEICGNNFSKWKPILKTYKAESEKT